MPPPKRRPITSSIEAIARTDDSDEWKGVEVELYPTMVDLKGNSDRGNPHPQAGRQGDEAGGAVGHLTRRRSMMRSHSRRDKGPLACTTGGPFSFEEGAI